MAKIEFLEFFAGCGLVRRGLEEAGFKCVFANDIDKSKEYIYKLNFGAGRTHFVPGDIKDLRAKDIPHAPLATASFPCVDLSLAGARGGLSKGRQSSTFFKFVNLLEKKPKSRRPKVVLLENVPGILTSGGGVDIRRALKELNRLGYKVDLFAADARWFVPQSRLRIFIIGVQSIGAKLNRKRFDDRDDRLKTARLIELVNDENADIDWSFIKIPSPPEREARKLPELLSESTTTWWPKERTAKFIDQTPDKTRKILEGACNKRNYLFGAAFRRMRKGKVVAEVRFDGLAGCLRPPRGGSSKQIVVRSGKGNIDARYLTARESCRLMGVDDFLLPAKESAGLFAMGDAVCAPLLTWIGKSFLKSFF